MPVRIKDIDFLVVPGMGRTRFTGLCCIKVISVEGKCVPSVRAPRTDSDPGVHQRIHLRGSVHHGAFQHGIGPTPAARFNLVRVVYIPGVPGTAQMLIGIPISRVIDIALVVHIILLLGSACSGTKGGTDKHIRRYASVSMKIAGPCVGAGRFLFGRRDFEIGHIVIRIVHIHLARQTELPHVAETVRRIGHFLRLAQGRQQHPRQDRDDGDHHQQFDQCELLQA